MEEADLAVDLRLIGPLALRVGGVARPLPQSRKTRALLAYLAVSGRPERRDMLCELLWDVPDDPRGALRWSLSKLRGILGDAEVIRADREWVELVLPDGAVDWRRLRSLTRRGLELASVEDLQRAAAGAGRFLEGLDLPRSDRFQAWLVANREDVRQWQAKISAELTARDLAPDVALSYARAWVDHDRYNPAAWQRLVELLHATGRSAEAEQQRALAARCLAEAGEVFPVGASAPASPVVESVTRPDIRFCSSRDGTKLAYAVAGTGPQLVKIANWMTHLELDVQGPIWRHWIEAFTRNRRLLRYDQRGNGLSDLQTMFSTEAYLADVEAVADAAKFDRFDLLGISHGASIAIAFAATHPERVRRLILLGGFPTGWGVTASPDEKLRREAMLTLTRQGWEQDNPALRQLFTTLFLPDSSLEEQRWFTEVQRKSTPVDNACAIQLASAETDVRDLLPDVRCPTLVAHCRNDAMVPFEAGRALASGIAGARFLTLESSNHALMAGEPAWARFRDAADAFLDEGLS